MFTIIHTYNPETESFCRIIQLGLQKVSKQPDYTFTEEWKNNDDEDIVVTLDLDDGSPSKSVHL